MSRKSRIEKEGEARLAFIDTETTGLYPELGHEPYEIAIVLDDGNEKVFRVRPNLEHADGNALRIGKFYERFRDDNTIEFWDSPRVAALGVAQMLDGRHLVGVNPAFDANMLTYWLRRNNQAPTWSHHLIDVVPLMAAWLAATATVDVELSLPPYDSNEMSRAIGINPDDFDRHTALGDARWSKAIYDLILKP